MEVTAELVYDAPSEPAVDRAFARWPSQKLLLRINFWHFLAAQITPADIVADRTNLSSATNLVKNKKTSYQQKAEIREV